MTAALAQPRVTELFDLCGRVAIVTGGARNLGLQMAQALAEVGATVVVTARRAEAATEAARDLEPGYLGLPAGRQQHRPDSSHWTGTVGRDTSGTPYANGFLCAAAALY